MSEHKLMGLFTILAPPLVVPLILQFLTGAATWSIFTVGHSRAIIAQDLSTDFQWTALRNTPYRPQTICFRHRPSIV